MAFALSLSDLFKSSFYATPHPYLLLNPNLQIIDANDCYLAATMTRRADIMQAGMFEVFPDNPADPNASGVSNLSKSLVRVLDTGQLDRMPLQRYDIRDEEGAFQERWWQPLNIPVFDENGRLATIVHYVEDVTEAQRAVGGFGSLPNDRETETALAAAVESSLREAEAHFVRQRAIIEELQRKGQPTKIVQSLFASLEKILAGHREYAQRLRQVSRVRSSAEDLYVQWSSAIADARSQLNRLDGLLGELRQNIGTSRQTIEESRLLIIDAKDGGQKRDS
jgi:hypothetical protein